MSSEGELRSVSADEDSEAEQLRETLLKRKRNHDESPNGQQRDREQDKRGSSVDISEQENDHDDAVTIKPQLAKQSDSSRRRHKKHKKERKREKERRHRRSKEPKISKHSDSTNKGGRRRSVSPPPDRDDQRPIGKSVVTAISDRDRRPVQQPWSGREQQTRISDRNRMQQGRYDYDYNHHSAYQQHGRGRGNDYGRQQRRPDDRSLQRGRGAREDDRARRPQSRDERRHGDERDDRRARDQHSEEHSQSATRWLPPVAGGRDVTVRSADGKNPSRNIVVTVRQSESPPLARRRRRRSASSPPEQKSPTSPAGERVEKGSPHSGDEGTPIQDEPSHQEEANVSEEARKSGDELEQSKSDAEEAGGSERESGSEAEAEEEEEHSDAQGSSSGHSRASSRSGGGSHESRESKSSAEEHEENGVRSDERSSSEAESRNEEGESDVSSDEEDVDRKKRSGKKQRSKRKHEESSREHSEERTHVPSKYSKFVSSSEDEDAEPGPSRGGRRRSRGSPRGHRHRGNAHAVSHSAEDNDVHMKTDDEQASTPESVKEEEKSVANALPAYYPAISGCRSVDKFDCLNRIEEGTYGVVYRAKDKHSDEIVALKRLKMEKEKEDFPITAMREIVTLLKAQHQNVVTVREIVVGSNMDKIYIVMDYVQHDLKSLMETMKTPFRIGEVKTLMRQLLAGVRHLHENWILHRDLKASNLLLSHDGILKIGDFGLAREYGSPLKPYTQVVVTLWYRAPELLLGTKFYSCAIDMWSVGCIFGEFLNLKPLFPGKSEIDELNKIYKDLGSPSERVWPGFNELPGAKRLNLPHVPTNTLRKRFDADLSEAGFDLLSKCLTYCPTSEDKHVKVRITARDALRHPWFDEAPRPIHPSMFPTWPAKSELCKLPKNAMQKTPPPPPGRRNADLAPDEEEILKTLPNAGAGGGFRLKAGEWHLKF